MHTTSNRTKPSLVDLGVAGVWLGLAQRDQFTSVLAQNNGDINALLNMMRQKVQQAAAGNQTTQRR